MHVLGNVVTVALQNSVLFVLCIHVRIFLNFSIWLFFLGSYICRTLHVISSEVICSQCLSFISVIKHLVRKTAFESRVQSYILWLALIVFWDLTSVELCMSSAVSSEVICSQCLSFISIIEHPVRKTAFESRVPSYILWLALKVEGGGGTVMN